MCEQFYGFYISAPQTNLTSHTHTSYQPHLTHTPLTSLTSHTHLLPASPHTHLLSASPHTPLTILTTHTPLTSLTSHTSYHPHHTHTSYQPHLTHTPLTSLTSHTSYRTPLLYSVFLELAIQAFVYYRALMQDRLSGETDLVGPVQLFCRPCHFTVFCLTQPNTSHSVTYCSHPLTLLSLRSALMMSSNHTCLTTGALSSICPA